MKGGRLELDQKKTGIFLKKLRNEKELTQEQLAEKFHVSARTISRWETGSNLPDISLLVEIADFYDVDVREIIEGEKKSEMMNDEVRDVATRMVDYAEADKSRLLKWIRVTGIIGVVVMAIAIVLQCVQYSPGLFSAGALFTSFIALLAIAVMTLYVNGVIEKLLKRKLFTTTVKAVILVILLICARFILGIVFVVGVGVLDYLSPSQKISGIENYDKPAIVEENSGDMDSCFMVFPDTTDDMIDAKFTSKVKTGLFDSDGYFILEAKYNSEDFENEIKRLSEIECAIEYRDDVVVNKIKYDEDMYNYPAYIASDGYDYVYEYALIDDNNNSIVYILISYPEYTNLIEYKDYLKKEPKEYNLDNNKVLENFTIYAHKFPGEDAWIEFE